MKKLLVVAALLSMANGAFAAGKSCDDLKGEIDAKIKAKGASSYSLKIADKGASSDGQVVGTCDGGSKEIVYKKG